MNLNKFTLKSQEALQNAQEIAASYGNPAIEPDHLLAALIQDPSGTVVPILQKAGANVNNVKIKVHDMIERLLDPRAERERFVQGGKLGEYVAGIVERPVAHLSG